MIAIRTITHDHVQALLDILAYLAQLLDLSNPYFDRIPSRANPLNINRQCPTSPSLGYPGQQGVGIAYHDGVPIDGSSRAMDILAIWQGRCRGPGPCTAIQGKDLT